MTDSAAQVARQFLHIRRLLSLRRVQIALAVYSVTLIASIPLAPDVEASTSDWVRLIAIGILAALGVLAFASASDRGLDESDRRAGLIGAAVVTAFSLILCLTFSLGTALVFSIGISLTTLIATTDIDERSPWALTGALLIVVPAWVWSALDAWSWGLLLLVPIGLIGVVSDGHLRAADALSPTVTSPLTSRGHRLAGWLGVLVAASLIVAFGIPGDSENAVILLGAAGALALVGIDMFSTGGSREAHWRLPLVDAALIWIVFCWIVSL